MNIFDFIPIIATAFALGMLYWNHRRYMKWYNSPEAIKERQKEAYDAAHAYTEGKCPVQD